MSKKLVLIMTLIFLIGISSVAFKVLRVEASGPIYIKADGSVDPPTASIQRDGNVYTLTGNINDSIVIERDNLVVDGAGYTLLPTGSGQTGIDLSDRNNVTIKNTNVKWFEKGILLNSTSNVVVLGNNITNNLYGVLFHFSNHTTISGNNITGLNRDVYSWGILGGGGNDYVIEENEVSNYEYGISIMGGDKTLLSKNLVYNCEVGILEDSSNKTQLSENVVDDCFCGFLFGERGENNVITGSNFTNNQFGIYEQRSADETLNLTVYHNNFINNVKNVDLVSSTCIWDNGLEGNYWSDYAGVDDDGNGIGDTPYVIDENNKDQHPLMAPYAISGDTTPPTISVLSPENKTYSVDDIALTFTVDESVSWIAYNLDGQSNVTITGNTTLSDLSDGSHSLVVYAKDTSGNLGASKTIYFSIEIQQGDLFPMWILGAIAIIIAVVLAFVTYLVKSKKTTEKVKQ